MKALPLALLVTLGIAAVGAMVWPTRYRYGTTNGLGGHQVQTRTDQLTGRTEMLLTGLGWRPDNTPLCVLRMAYDLSKGGDVWHEAGSSEGIANVLLAASRVGDLEDRCAIIDSFEEKRGPHTADAIRAALAAGDAARVRAATAAAMTLPARTGQ